MRQCRAEAAQDFACHASSFSAAPRKRALLGERLAKRGDLDVTLSLAGRTATPVPHAVPVRVGGFGGAAGLAAYLVSAAHRRIDRRHASLRHYHLGECRCRGAPDRACAFMTLRRPPWTAVAGDRWIEVGRHRSRRSAPSGRNPRGVFVALGRNELAPFAGAPQHRYLVRSVDPVDPPLPLPHVTYVTARGPFSEADDRALMTAHEIDVVIAKNSGGSAAYGKIAAARALGIDVIMLRRPPRARRARGRNASTMRSPGSIMRSTSAAARGV